MDASEYHNIYKLEESHFYYVGIHKVLMSQIEKYLSSNKPLRILDAGCGTGLFAKKLERLGEVIAIDTNRIAIKLAKKRGVNAIQASTTKLPFKNNSFDLVVSIDVIYHKNVNSDKEAVDELYRVLKPDGILILKVPAYNWLYGKHDELVHTRKRYKTDDFKKLFKNAGFKIIKLSYMASFLLPIAFIKRLFEKKDNNININSDVQMPNFTINYLFCLMFNIEAKILKVANLPFGLSVLCIARKSK